METGWSRFFLKLPYPGLMRERLNEQFLKSPSVGASQLTRFTSTIGNRMDGIVTRVDSPHSSGRIEGVNRFIKGSRRSDFGYFAPLIWEQTHRRKRYRSPDGSLPRQYPRKLKTNSKCLRQTGFLLDEALDEMAS